MKRKTLASTAPASFATQQARAKRKDMAASMALASEDANGRTLFMPDQLHAIVAQGAYFRAEQRGFEPGHELDDWLAAEKAAAEVCGTAFVKTRADIG